MFWRGAFREVKRRSSRTTSIFRRQRALGSRGLNFLLVNQDLGRVSAHHAAMRSFQRPRRYRFFDESACARRVLKALARSRRPRISHSQQAFSALNRPSFPLKSQKMTCLCRFFLPFVATATRRPAVFSAATAKDPTEGSARRCNVSGTIE